MKTWSSKDIVPNAITCSTLISARTAVKADGSVRAWRYGGRGGDASSVKTQLAEGVQYVAATCDADAAVKADGSVVLWSARKLVHPNQKGGHHHGAQTKRPHKANLDNHPFVK